jgi:hypothetical protein
MRPGFSCTIKAPKSAFGRILRVVEPAIYEVQGIGVKLPARGRGVPDRPVKPDDDSLRGFTIPPLPALAAAADRPAWRTQRPA